MKKLITIAILLIAINSFGQDVVGSRVIAKQALYVNGVWVDSIRVDTVGISSDNRTLMTSGAIYKFVSNRSGGGSGTFSNTIDSMGYIDANAYGMIPDDGLDDTQALQNALNDAAAYGAEAVTIYIKRPGTYNIDGALQTSVDGVNPNAQVYIPLNRDTTSLKRIRIMGANAPHLLVSGIGGSDSYNYGVVLKSGITASASSVPCILGSSFYNTGFGNFTLVSLDLENLTFVTRTKTAGIDIAPSMSALNLVAVAQVTINNVKVITESVVGSQVSPIGKATYGIVMPGNNNRGISQIGLVNVNGYEYGIKVSEHFEGNNIFVSACGDGIYVDAAAHGIHINNLSAEACINSIYVFYTNGISLDMYQSEHVTLGRWNDFAYDVYFNSTGRVTIFRAQPTESGVGPVQILTTNTLSQLDVCEVSNTARTFFYKGTGKFLDYQSGSVQDDAIRAVSNTAGASFGVENINSGGYSGIEYFDNTGTLKTFTGYENTGGNFRFNHVGTGGINFKISSVDKFKINNDGTITMGDYGSGTNTGTATKWAAYTSAGLLIEKDPPVSSIFRTAGIDSTYFTINGVQYAIKDSTGGGGTPGGSNKQIQYNNSSSFGGATGFEYGNSSINLQLTQQAASDTAFKIIGASSGTGNLLTIRDNSNNALFNIRSNGANDIQPTFQPYYSAIDEFVFPGHTFFAVNATGAGSGATVMTSVDIIRGWYGGVKLGTGTTSTGYAYFTNNSTSSTNTTAAVYLDSNYRYNGGARVRLEDLGTGGEAFVAIFGLQPFAQLTNGNYTYGVFFRYQASDSSGQWIAVTMNNIGNKTEKATGITVAADTNYDLEISIYQGTAYYYINKVLVQTINTNIPYSALDAGWCGVILKYIGSTNRYMYVDWAAYGVRNN